MMAQARKPSAIAGPFVTTYSNYDLSLDTQICCDAVSGTRNHDGGDSSRHVQAGSSSIPRAMV
jgi:hypothetical protein